MLNMCFFKCGSCENATEVGTQSGMGHLNGFSPIIFFGNYLFPLISNVAESNTCVFPNV